MLTKVELFLRQEFPIDFFPLPSLLVSCSSLSLSFALFSTSRSRRFFWPLRSRSTKELTRG